MGKKNKSSSNLGRSLIKDRFGAHRGRKLVENNSMLHTTELQDGYDWGRLNLQSVTEESSFQEFLATAELAGTEFQGEKLNISFVNSRPGVLTKAEISKIRQEHQEKKDFLKIPRRPPWTRETSADELDRQEKESFLEWRRGLSILQEEQGLILTPFEKNLEFWRQLWRVVERSDIVVQIVDARNPLLFWCNDLEKYVTEVSTDKMSLVLINKADFLSEEQRKMWGEYFKKQGVNVAFFSAKNTLEMIEEEEEEKESEATAAAAEQIEKEIENLEDAVNKTAEKLSQILGASSASEVSENFPLLGRSELMSFFRHLHSGKTKATEGVTTVGLVGYPNVGKSSTINSLLGSKKVQVSATPGKTRHFQTLYAEKDLLLCDCPGLVMPSFVTSRAEMIVNGILPVDQMKDHIPPSELVVDLIPRAELEHVYGLTLPVDDDDPQVTAAQLLDSHALNRGFMTANGQPDRSRSAKIVLKDFVNGRLLYCHPPPGVAEEEYKKCGIAPEFVAAAEKKRPAPAGPTRAAVDKLDNAFFSGTSSTAHVRSAKMSASAADLAASAKPWKQINKHANKKKREKLRRVYAHLDRE